MRGAALLAGCVALAGCALLPRSDTAPWWTPAASQRVCMVYLRVPPSAGGMAWVVVAPLQDFRQNADKARLQVVCGDAWGGKRWELGDFCEDEIPPWTVVSIHDVDGDGWDEIAVGTWSSEPAPTYGTGCVRMISGRTGALIWRADGMKQRADMGVCVGRVADWNGDGTEDVIACAPGEGAMDDGCGGCIVILSGRTGGRLWQADILGGTENDSRRVCAMDDLDGDGLEEVVVGMEYAGPGGCVQVYGSRTGARIRQFDAPVEGGNFGIGVARTRDFDGDGIRDLLVAAPTESDGGALYLLSGADGSALRVLRGDPENEVRGWMIELPDCDGDGIPEVSVFRDRLIDGRGWEGFQVLSGRSLEGMGDFKPARLR